MKYITEEVYQKFLEMKINSEIPAIDVEKKDKVKRVQ